VDSTKKWGLGYGFDVVAASHFTSTSVIQQAFVEGKWLKGVITIGSKEQPPEMKDLELSSGSQTLGINARPVPQVRLSLPDFWNIPGTKGFLALKGHFSYGILTDGSWQKDFNTSGSKYQKNVLYHSKAGYLRLGNEKKFPLTVEAGLEMATLFGGTVYRNNQKYTYPSGLKSLVKAFIPFNETRTSDLYTAEGDMVGSTMLSVSYQFPTWRIRTYMDHFFEDGSAMYMLDYDGYGSGADWNKKVKNRFLVYEPKDGMYGLEVTPPKNNILTKIVLEYLYTKYQSGPVYYDHSPEISDHIGGRDDYYNHGTYTGWQHWGQVMGNPLFLSPIYNDDGSIYVKDNRFVAWHLGLSGDPSAQWHYRALLTCQKGWGTYQCPYNEVKKNTSWMAECSYLLPPKIWKIKTSGWCVRAALGSDQGALMGNNFGGQLTISKTGLFETK